MPAIARECNGTYASDSNGHVLICLPNGWPCTHVPPTPKGGVIRDGTEASRGLGRIVLP